MHNSRLVQYRLSRLRSTGQAKEKEERGSMKDSFRVGRVQLSLHSVEREIGETLGSSSKNSPLYFSIKNSLSILSRCILDTLETVSKYDVKGREIKKKIKKGGASELPRADGSSLVGSIDQVQSSPITFLSFRPTVPVSRFQRKKEPFALSSIPLIKRPLHTRGNPKM